MNLSDVLDHDRLLLVVCHDCTARIPLDPVGFALRHGVHATVASLKPEIVCPACGSNDFSLRAFSPIETAPERMREPAGMAD